MTIQTVSIFKHGPNDPLGLLPQAFAQLNVQMQVHDITDLSQPLPTIDGMQWAVILGSPESAYDDNLPWLAREMDFIQNLQAADKPLLGICFGSQIVARALGGSVYLNTEFENAWVTLDENAKTLGLEETGPWLTFHFDAFTPPPEAVLLGKTALANQAYVCGQIMGVQFHPEIDSAMFANWLAHWGQTEQGREFMLVHAQAIEDLKLRLSHREQQGLNSLVKLLQGFLTSVVKTEKCL